MRLPRLFRLRQSIWSRIVWRTLAIFAALAALAIFVLDVNGSMDRQHLAESALVLQGAQLLPYLQATAERQKPELPAPIANIYSPASRDRFFAIFTREGTLLWSSNAAAAALSLSNIGQVDAARPAFVRTEIGSDSFVALVQEIPGSPNVLVVGNAMDSTRSVAGMLLSLVEDHNLWILLVLLLATFLAVIWTLGGSVRTVRVIGRQADAITSVVPDIRLDTRNAPAEVQPAIAAINGAFDRLSKAYAAHRNFSVRMAHELRGPLAVLSLRLEKLGEESTAEVLRSDVQRLKRLVEQLTGMIRLETGAVEAATDFFDFAKVVEDVISDSVPAGLARRVSLGFDGPGPGCFVKGDRAAIWLAIRNLVENALLHSPPDTEVDITLTRGGLLTVRDHGPGVNPEHRPKIFQRFWRAPNAPSGGSGLGLAIVEEVALQHEGTASVTNHPEGGAIFSLQLPTGGLGKVQESRSA